MILSFLFYFFLAYVLFKLVFNFIIPVYRTTSQVKKSFNEMRQKMHQPSAHSAPQDSSNASTRGAQKPAGDYIDFEEVKD